MKKCIIAVITVLLFVGIATAGERWEIRPKYFDLDPYDGLFDPGSYFNPYVIVPSDPYEPRYEIRPRYFDLDPYDGLFDPGSYFNPYVIEEE